MKGRPPRVIPMTQRVEEHVERDPNSGCWLWTGTLLSSGYGQVAWRKNRDLAHRASYAAFKQSIPAGQSVLHKCDTPACVNPDHLFLGTQLDNMRDKMDKHRGGHSHAKSGEQNHKAKLTRERAAAIRVLSGSGISLRVLSREFGVAIETIRAVIKGRTWREQTAEAAPPRAAPCSWRTRARRNRARSAGAT